MLPTTLYSISFSWLSSQIIEWLFLVNSIIRNTLFFGIVVCPCMTFTKIASPSYCGVIPFSMNHSNSIRLNSSKSSLSISNGLRVQYGLVTIDQFICAGNFDLILGNSLAKYLKKSKYSSLVNSCAILIGLKQSKITKYVQ